MFIHTRAVIAKILDDLQKIAFACFLIVQFGYIVFLSTSLFLNSGILIINTVLLITSTAYLILRVLSYKTDFNNKKAIMKLGNTSYRRIKIATQIFTVFSMLYGFFVASEQQNSWSLVIILSTFLLCVVQILIECAIQFVDNRKELFIDALKHDFEGFIKTADFFKKLRGDKDSLWGNADKNNDELKEIKRSFKEAEKERKNKISAERKQSRKENRAERKARFLAKIKKEPSV